MNIIFYSFYLFISRCTILLFYKEIEGGKEKWKILPNIQSKSEVQNLSYRYIDILVHIVNQISFVCTEVL